LPPGLAVGACLLVGAIVLACGSGTPTARPSPSLVTLDFTPLPTNQLPSLTPSRTPKATAITGSWPVGWDVAFCNAFADSTVAHELVIDIERAIADDNRTDAQGLANELAQTTPIASTEVTKLNDWAPAADVKTDLTTVLDLDTQAATAYQSYFNDDVKSALRQARQLRNQVSKQVGPINDALDALSAQGLSCPGTDLKLESF
jgi:hypothetical protein